MRQRAAHLAIARLESQAAATLLHWGYLPAIFAAKAYDAPRVPQAWARDMLAANPVFAASPQARLSDFFERRPWPTSQAVGADPVPRLAGPALAWLQPALTADP